jgi:hypothetical protein
MQLHVYFCLGIGIIANPFAADLAADDLADV